MVGASETGGAIQLADKNHGDFSNHLAITGFFSVESICHVVWDWNGTLLDDAWLCVEATTAFLASGAQPFRSHTELELITAPTLLVPGTDAMHPREITDFYAKHIPHCTIVEPPKADVGQALREFCERAAIW